jgi:hypothetical protein
MKLDIQSETSYRELVRTVATRQSVLYVGSGISHSSEGMPLWDELVLNIARNFKDYDGTDQCKERLLSHKLEYLEWRQDTYPVKFEEEFSTLLKQRRRIAPIHKGIAQLEWNAVLTTNFDTLLEEAFEGGRKKFCPVEDVKGMALAMKQRAMPIIKLHGSLSHDINRILTATDYQRFDEDKIALKEFALGYLMHNSVLFLGAGLSDPTLAKLFQNIFSRLKGYSHPCFYVAPKVPEYINYHWGRRHGFRFIVIEHAENQKFMESLCEDVEKEKRRISPHLGTLASAMYSKEGAIKGLADLMASDRPDPFKLSHGKYLESIHSSDYRAFALFWEETLYKPLRENIMPLISTQGRNLSIAYVGPGAHAPFFLDTTSNDRIEECIKDITLIDILDETLMLAKNGMSLFLPKPISIQPQDISLGLGDAWFKLLKKILELPSLEYMADLSANPNLDALIPAKGKSEEQPSMGFDFIFSEMVASFVGTPPLMAFQKCLKDLHAKKFGNGSKVTLDAILKNVSTAWRKFNDISYRTQLAWAARNLKPGGLLAVAVDIKKVFDAPGKEPLESFFDLRSLTTGIQDILNCEDIPFKSIWWNDHPYGMSDSEPDDDNFLRHRHQVEIYCYRKK